MDKEFRIILREFLEEKELTNSQFAKIIGVKPSQVTEWLRGKAKPGYDTLKKIATVFQVSADYFLNISDKIDDTEIH